MAFRRRLRCEMAQTSTQSLRRSRQRIQIQSGVRGIYIGHSAGAGRARSGVLSHAAPYCKAYSKAYSMHSGGQGQGQSNPLHINLSSQRSPNPAAATRGYNELRTMRPLGQGTLEEYRTVRPLGQGTFGRVMLVQHVATGRNLAMKVQRVDSILSQDESMEARAHLARMQSIFETMPEGMVQAHFMDAVAPLEEKINSMAPKEGEFRTFEGATVHRAIAELELGKHLARMAHPFVVKLHDGFIENGECFLFFDFASAGTLKQYTASCGGKLPADAVRTIVAELVLAIEHLQSRDIAHRDLKPENIMLSQDGHIMLADFGLAVRGQSEVRTVCGTAEYVPPEVLSSGTYDPAFVDRWALGIIVFELTAGRTPFGDINAKAVFLNILTTTLQFPEDFSATAADLVQTLLQHEPKQRPTMKTVRQHPYFDGMDWDDVLHKRVEATMPGVADETVLFLDEGDAPPKEPAGYTRPCYDISALTTF